MNRILAGCTLLACAWTASAHGESLRLLDANGGAKATVAVMQPFDVYLVAARDSLVDISAVAFTLEVADGVQILGEELLVESILGLGSSRAGLNLVFRCTQGPTLRVLHFRCVATRPLSGKALRLLPDTRTSFLGIVSCRPEDFAKFESTLSQFDVETRGSLTAPNRAP